MPTQVVKIDQSRWRALTALFQDYNYHQIWDFGVACAHRMGSVSEHVALRKNGQDIGLADVRLKKIPGFNTGIAYINGGPLTRQNGAEHADALKCSLQALIDEYVRQRKLVLRIRPTLGDPQWNQQQQEIYRRLGFASPDKLKPYHTFLLDINKSLDDIRKNLKQKWRNCLNNAEKKECQIHAGPDPELLEKFCRLYDVLVARKKFNTDLDAQFYYRLRQEISSAEGFYASIAEHQGQAVAGHVSSMLGDTCVYLLGASNPEGLRQKASYLLQWHTIEVARQRGCIWYDLGGIDPEKNPGVYHFKKGLGGMEITVPGPYEIYPNAFSQKIVAWSEKLYRIYKNIRKY